MVYSLDIHLITNKQAIIDAVLVNLPAKLDAKVWADEYVAKEGIDENDNKFVHAKIRFNQDADRSVVWNWMKNKKDEASAFILTGSEIRLHTCYHDENPPRPCEETWLWRMS